MLDKDICIQEQTLNAFWACFLLGEILMPSSYKISQKMFGPSFKYSYWLAQVHIFLIRKRLLTDPWVIRSLAQSSQHQINVRRYFIDKTIDVYDLCLHIIIIIIMSCRQHGYPWPSLAITPYRSLPLAGLQGYIPYPHIVAVCMFDLVVLLLLGSIGVHNLWARPCFSSSVLHVWFV